MIFFIVISEWDVSGLKKKSENPSITKPGGWCGGLVILQSFAILNRLFTQAIFFYINAREAKSYSITETTMYVDQTEVPTLTGFRLSNCMPIWCSLVLFQRTSQTRLMRLRFVYSFFPFEFFWWSLV